MSEHEAAARKIVHQLDVEMEGRSFQGHYRLAREKIVARALAAAAEAQRARADELRVLGEGLLRRVSDAEDVAEELAAVVAAAKRYREASDGPDEDELERCIGVEVDAALAALSPAARSTLAAGSGLSAASAACTSAKPSGVNSVTGARDSEEGRAR